VPSGFVLDTKSKSSAKKNQEDEFKRQLREIEKRQEEEVKLDPIAIINQEAIVIGDERIALRPQNPV
jgi:hypothetical protein